MAKFLKSLIKYTSPVGYMAVSAHDKQKAAGREAKAVLEEQGNRMREAQNALRSEQQRTDAQLEATRSRIAQGQARANRARIRGGLFGPENQVGAPGVLNARLG